MLTGPSSKQIGQWGCECVRARSLGSPNISGLTEQRPDYCVKTTGTEYFSDFLLSNVHQPSVF